VPDVVFWSWGIPIFSSKLRENIESIDQNPGEFWKCRFLSNPGEEFFMHLPSKAFDLIDVEKSTFKSVLPTNPPLRLFLEAAVVKNYPTELPGCFRCENPGTGQVFSEVFVRADFPLLWQRMGYSGASFVKLS
jgi:hypothetical protein